MPSSPRILISWVSIRIFSVRTSMSLLSSSDCARNALSFSTYESTDAGQALPDSFSRFCLALLSSVSSVDLVISSVRALSRMVCIKDCFSWYVLTVSLYARYRSIRSGSVSFSIVFFSASIPSICFLACPSSNGELHTGHRRDFLSLERVLLILSMMDCTLPISMLSDSPTDLSGTAPISSVSSLIFDSAIARFLVRLSISFWYLSMFSRIVLRLASFTSLNDAMYRRMFSI